MNNFVTCVGWFTVAMLALALACFAVCCVLWLYEKAMERFAWSVDAKTRMDLGRAIGAASYWFSENPDTSLALRILGERLGKGLSAEPNDWRDQWQKGRKQPVSENVNHVDR